jgi:hypothetical protein
LRHRAGSVPCGIVWVNIIKKDQSMHASITLHCSLYSWFEWRPRAHLTAIAAALHVHRAKVDLSVKRRLQSDFLPKRTAWLWASAKTVSEIARPTVPALRSAGEFLQNIPCQKSVVGFARVEAFIYSAKAVSSVCSCSGVNVPLRHSLHR